MENNTNINCDIGVNVRTTYNLINKGFHQKKFLQYLRKTK